MSMAETVENTPAQPTRSKRRREIKPYDFQHQEALERGKLRRLDPVLEVVAHRMGGALTSALRLPCRVEVSGNEQERWESYASSLPEPTFLCSVTVVPYGGRIVLHLPLPLAFATVDIRMGGDGRSPQPERALTEIEQRLITDLAQQMLEEMPPAFSPLLSMSFGAFSAVASSMFLQATKPTEICLIVTLRITLGDLAPVDATLCIPIPVIIPILDVLERTEATDREDTHADLSQIRLRERFLEVPLTVSVCYPDVTLPSDDLLSLQPGDVIPLRRSADEPLELRVEGAFYKHVQATSKGRRVAAVVIEEHKETFR